MQTSTAHDISNVVQPEESFRGLEVELRPCGETYEETLARQLVRLEEKASGRDERDTLIFVEHDHVYTVGRGESGEQFEGSDVPWFEVGRGGKATYHGPGQLVCYPLFHLERHGKDVHKFLRQLEDVVIRVLAKVGIEAQRVEGLTGIWVLNGTRKIASIGIGVRRWVSYHGLALNVNPEMSYFRAISPCGQDGAVMTSLAELLDQVPSMEKMREHMLSAFREVFGFPEQRIDGRQRPEWLKVRAPGSVEFRETNDVIRKLRLVTVCEEARCPNIGECWSHHTATMMIMGDLCTRRCSFCAVKDGTLGTLKALDKNEPHRVAIAVKELQLQHVVITSVNRDDVPDMGAAHFNQTVREIKALTPQTRVELLIPDMRGDRALVEQILDGGMVSVLNHNLETVPRLYRTVRPGANFKRSLNVLRWAKELHPTLQTKSGIMAGLGETRDEVLEVMDALRENGVSILTIGQYLQPTAKQLAVERFVTPAEFEDYQRAGEARGFSYVESGPFVRSSYHAWRHSIS